MACILCKHKCTKNKAEIRINRLVGNVNKLLQNERKIFTLVGHRHEASEDDNDNRFSLECAECNLFRKLDRKNIIPILDQTYSRWKSSMTVLFEFWRLRHRRIIYIVPLGEFPPFITAHTQWTTTSSSDIFSLVSGFCEVYFQERIQIKLLPQVASIDNWKLTRRNHHKTGKQQILSGDFYPYLKKIIPKDGHSILGITYTDLYPEEKLNFELGEASMRDKCGIFCFGRYPPSDFTDSDISAIDGNLIWKLLKVVSHETCHLFDLQHCTFYNCNMNESKSILEAMCQPLTLCPVCLRKLHKVCKFDSKKRYHEMATFLQMVNTKFQNDNIITTIDWLKGILLFLDTNTNILQSKDSTIAT